MYSRDPGCLECSLCEEAHLCQGSCIRTHTCCRWFPLEPAFCLWIKKLLSLLLIRVLLFQEPFVLMNSHLFQHTGKAAFGEEPLPSIPTAVTVIRVFVHQSMLSRMDDVSGAVCHLIQIPLILTQFQPTRGT